MLKSSGLLNLRRIFLDLKESLTVLSLVFSGKLLLRNVASLLFNECKQEILGVQFP